MSHFGERSIAPSRRSKRVELPQLPMNTNLPPKLRKIIAERTNEMHKVLLEKSFFQKISKKEIESNLRFLLEAMNSNENYNELLDKFK